MPAPGIDGAGGRDGRLASRGAPGCHVVNGPAGMKIGRLAHLELLAGLQNSVEVMAVALDGPRVSSSREC